MARLIAFAAADRRRDEKLRRLGYRIVRVDAVVVCVTSPPRRAGG